MSKRRGLAFTALAGLSFLLGIAAAFLIASRYGGKPMKTTTQLLFLAVQELLLIGLPALCLTLRNDAGRERALRLLRPPDVYPAGLVSVAAVSFSLGAVLIAGLWIALLNSLGLRPPLDEAAVLPEGLGEYLLALACAALLPAFSEELMFRGLLLPWLRRRMGDGLACLLSALLFALLHLSVLGFASLLVIGLVLARLMTRFGSLWLPILFHGLYNAVVLLLNALNARPSPAMVMLTSGVFIAAYYLLFRKEDSKAWS